MEIVCGSYVLFLVMIVGFFAVRANARSQKEEQKKQEEAEMLAKHPKEWMKIKELEHERLKVQQMQMQKAAAEKPAGGGLLSGVLGLVFKIILGRFLKI